MQGIDEEASAVVFENDGDEERLKTSFETGLRMTILILVDTLCFTNLGKLNLIIVVRFSARANSRCCPSCLKKWSSLQKWSKLTQK
jgi:hypothetical protein